MLLYQLSYTHIGNIVFFSSMRFHIGRRGELNIHYKYVKTLILQTRFKIVRLTTIRNESKRTISTSGGLELLQMVSEPNTEYSVSEIVEFPKNVET